MREILAAFDTDGEPIRCVSHGSGHINRTWLVETERRHSYILQQVNTDTFRDPEGLMNNIIRVTAHLRKKDPDPRHVLTLVRMKDGRPYLLENGELWRMYEFVTGGICLDRAETPDDMCLSGKAFGRFQQQMADFPAKELKEVIPGFHDTPARFRALRRAAETDTEGRASRVQPEIRFVLNREGRAGRLTEMLDSGGLPLRVTHNDTKLNNVMLDEQTREPLCILDLDTVMPGLAAHDFGDSIRFGASTAAEDEPDGEKVHLDLNLYQAYTRGFLSACGKSLTENEMNTLADGAWAMTMECAARFLTDYLEGDRYFHTDRLDQNLDRARTQMILAREMEEKEGQIRAMIRQIRKEEGI